MEMEIEKPWPRPGGFLQRGHWASLSYNCLDLSFVNLVKESDFIFVILYRVFFF